MNKSTIFQSSVISFIILLAFALISTQTLSQVLAKPSNGFLSSGNCSYSYNKLNTQKTCCWRSGTTTYKFPTPTYCQTCEVNDDGSYSNCSNPILQRTIDSNKGGDITFPKDNGGVLSNNDDSGGSGIPKGIDPSTGGTFNDNNNPSGSKGIDSSKINSGGSFNQ